MGSRRVHRQPYCRGLEQKGQSDLRLPSASSVSWWYLVSSKFKSWLLGSRGVRRHPYCRGLEQKDKVTFGYPRCPQCPSGPESAKNVKSWMWGSKGVNWYPFCLVSKENFLSAQISSFSLLCLLLYKILYRATMTSC